MMMKNNDFLEAFIKLGNDEVVSNDILKKIESFVCAMYGMKSEQDVNVARFNMFTKLYCPKKKNVIKKIKSTDPCCLPPCKDVLQQKIKRANYVASLWINSMNPGPIRFSATNNGWELSKTGKIEIVWFKGPQNPIDLCLDSNDKIIYGDDQDDEDYGYNVSSDEDVDFEGNDDSYIHA